MHYFQAPQISEWGFGNDQMANTCTPIYSSAIAHQHTALLTLPDCNMPLIEAADAAYQGCLPSCELHSRSLIVEHTGKVCRLRMQIMQSWDCTRVTQSPDCARVTQSQDWLLMSLDSENAQCYLKTVQILRLRGTYSRKSLIRTCWDQRVFR